MEQIKDIDFKYYVDYDYDTKYDCSSYGCDTICRCGKIINEKIESVNYKEIVDRIYDIYNDDSDESIRNRKLNKLLSDIPDEIDYYTIDRILRIHDIHKNESWYIEIENGYYGEEIGEVSLIDSDSVQEDISNALQITSLKDRILFLLELEYGYLLPELLDKEFNIDTINFSEIDFSQSGHYRKVKKRNLEHYNDSKYSNIRGIVISNGIKYRLIDGYHRCLATNEEKIKVINLT